MTLTVRDLMTEGPLVVARPDDAVELAGNMMAWTRVRHLPVVDDGALVGLLSERDVIRAQGLHPGQAVTVRAAMRTPVAWIGPDAPIETALSMMVSHNYGCLPVVAEKGLIGMLTTADLLRHQLYAAFDRPSPPVAPSASVAAFALRIEQVAAFEFRVRFDKEHYAELLTDEPPPLGGDTAPNPARLLAAAVGTCLCASLELCLRKQGQSVSGVGADVHLDLIRNEHRRLRVGRIDVRLHPAANVSAEALRACVGVFEDFCTVTESVRHGIEVKVAVEPRGAHPLEAPPVSAPPPSE